MPEERQGAVTFKGNPMTLVGPDPQVGAEAPDFNVIDATLSPVTRATDAGKVRLIIAVPSLDTPVCSLETKKFSDRIKELPNGVVTYVISADLPFAQKRFCGTEGIDNVRTLSDHRDLSFARHYGVLIQDLKLLARSVFVLDAGSRLTYKQVVSEVTNEPDYDAALAAAQKASRQ